MRYIPSTEEQKQEMLKTIGVSSFEELLTGIPEEVRTSKKLDIPSAMSEAELEEKITQIAEKNANFRSCKPLIGAGAYRHFIPEAVKYLLQREEFWTAYTPYQPELSQGTLQTMFEYQSFIARLTGMEVVIPSIYDGASATAEAALMSMRLTRRNKLVVSSLLHPHYRDTVRTYTAPHQTEIIELSHKEMRADSSELKELLDADDVAAVIVQNPNFFGGVENVSEIAAEVHSREKTLLINSIAESMSLALLKAPGEMDVDIVAGEGQSFGMNLNYGGPYNAFLAARKQYIRQIPGRIVGETVDADGKRVEILCANCGAHLGHVFEGEGLTEKNVRHCVNSISMRFKPEKEKANVKKAYFAGGCFWGVEYFFEREEGVISATSGYMGGALNNPTYEDVVNKYTGHLEVVEVTYDENRVSYEDLAKLFFEIHDPTQANGQGPDIGEQYRSAIFVNNKEDKETAYRLIDILKKKGYHIVTNVLPVSIFWKAEEYHQDYYSKSNKKPYCHRYTKRF